MQFDDATKINVSRMIHDMESGSFLPAQLDTDEEANYNAQNALIREKGTEIIKELNKNSVTDPSKHKCKACLEEHNRFVLKQFKYLPSGCCCMLSIQSSKFSLTLTVTVLKVA